MLYFIPVPTYSLIDKGAFQMKQTGKEHIHFIGIGGSSMSGLAELAAKQGCLVSGSDRTDSEKLRHLREKGIRIYPSQSSDNITDDIDLVVYTLAVPDSNPELKRDAEGFPSWNEAFILEKSQRITNIPSPWREHTGKPPPHPC